MYQADKRADPGVARGVRMIAVAVALAGLTLTGCSLFSSDSSERRAALGGGSEFETRAEKLCYSPAPPTDAADLRDAGRLAGEQADFRRSALADLRRLTPPEAGAQTFDRYTASLGRVESRLRRQATAAEQEDRAAFERSGIEANQELAAAAQFAAGLGLDRCAQTTSQPGGGGAASRSTEIGAEADRACDAANQRLLARTPQADDRGALARYYAQALAVRQRLAKKLESLDPQQAQRATFSGFMAASDDRVASARQLRTAAQSGAGALRAARQNDQAAYERESLAAGELGMKVCGQSGTVGG